MIKLLLLLHFVMGAILPFIAERTTHAIIKLNHCIDWLDNGFIQHQEFSQSKSKALLWLTVLIGYLGLYGFVLYVSMCFLHSNY